MNKIKTFFDNFLKDDFNNWYWRLCCLCLSASFMILFFLIPIYLIYMTFRYSEVIDQHFYRCLLVVVITMILNFIFLLLSKFFYKLYFKIKSKLATNVEKEN